jgi:hypothetical protein
VAIEKYISADWEVRNTFDEPVKIASGFQPEAYVHPEIQKFAEEITPDPKVCYAHVIAMSDGGHYGSNMNGDWFRQDELTGMQSPEEAAKNVGDMNGTPVPRFKTFEQAKFFRHHANGQYDPFYGDVPLAVWNEAMKRVELIIRIFREAIPEIEGSHGAPEIALKIDGGGHITVSMGCRIHHEQCMYCGNENEYVSQRCPHLKNQMNEIMPDGRLVAADNFGMRFFDISDVTIPADPIAYSLGKVAEFDPAAPRDYKSRLQRMRERRGEDEHGRPLGEKNAAYDVVDGEKHSIWRKKWAEIEKEIPCGMTIDDVKFDEPKRTSEPMTQFDTDELRTMVKNASGMNQIVSTLAACGVVLLPHELVGLSVLSNAELVNSPFKTAEFDAPTSLSLDNFSYGLYHSIQSKFADRSGFLAPCPETGWEPEKLAEYAEVGDYYAYYRKLLGSLTVDDFTKSAYHNPLLRELIGDADDHERVKAAMYYLAHAGIATP